MGDGYLVMGGGCFCSLETVCKSDERWEHTGRELGGSLEEGGGGSLEEAQLDSLLLPSTYCVWTGFTLTLTNFNI